MDADTRDGSRSAVTPGSSARSANASTGNRSNGTRFGNPCTVRNLIGARPEDDDRPEAGEATAGGVGTSG